MKRGFLVLFAASAIVACAARSESRGGDAGDVPSACTQNSCSGDEHLCKCATGSYCLIIGAECIEPTSPCPPVCP